MKEYGRVGGREGATELIRGIVWSLQVTDT